MTCKALDRHTQKFIAVNKMSNFGFWKHMWFSDGQISFSATAHHYKIVGTKSIEDAVMSGTYFSLIMTILWYNIIWEEKYNYCWDNSTVRVENMKKNIINVY